MIDTPVDHMIHATKERLILHRKKEASVLCVNFINNNVRMHQEVLEAMTQEGSMMQAYPHFCVEEVHRCAPSLA